MQKLKIFGLIRAFLIVVSLGIVACNSPSEPEEAAAVAEPEQAQVPAVEPSTEEIANAKAEAQIIAAATDTARDVARNPVPNPPEEAEASVTKEAKTLVDYLPNLGPAPEVTNEIWINSDEPLRLESLRGKVVLVEFWTFG